VPAADPLLLSLGRIGGLPLSILYDPARLRDAEKRRLARILSVAGACTVAFPVVGRP